QLFALVPFRDERSPDGELRLGAPLHLAAFEVTATVSAELVRHPVLREQVLSIEPPGWFAASDSLSIISNGYYALGTAHAGLDSLTKTLVQRPLPHVARAKEALSEALARCRADMRAAQDAPSTPEETKHTLR